MLLGAGSLREQLADYVQSHNLDRQVHLLGKLENVSSILAASDVFVLASNWEGNPLAVMEAMAAGLPVIATNVGGVPELVQSGEHGILVPAGDAAGFGRAMKCLLEDSEKRAAMANAAHARALREFRLERMVQGYADLYQETMSISRRTQTQAMTTWPATHLQNGSSK